MVWTMSKAMPNSNGTRTVSFPENAVLIASLKPELRNASGSNTNGDLK